MDINRKDFDYEPLTLEHVYSDEPIQLSEVNENLEVLTIIGHPLYCLKEIEKIPCLTELWIVECSLIDAGKVWQCKSLRKLYLYSNVLSKVPENLPNLQYLRVLWLNGNSIEQIEDYELPSRLIELNLADNYITNIGKAFDNCLHLSILNLSGNPIYDIFEIKQLKRLSCLSQLWFSDPLYKMSHLSKMINYRCFTVFSLPQLKELDSFPVEERELECAKKFIFNKLTFYKMQTDNILYKYMRNKLDYSLSIYRDLSNVRRKLFTLAINASKAKGKGDSKIALKCRQLHSFLDRKVEDWQNKRTLCESELKEHFEMTLYQHDIELEYFGNIIFKRHDKSSPLIRVCEKFLEECICNHLKLDLSIRGVEVDLVSQVMNSRLCTHFEVQLMQDVAADLRSANLYILCEPFGVQPSYEPFLDYVRLVLSIPEINSKKHSGTQCIGMADSEWLDKTIKLRRNVNCEEKNMRRYLIIVCSSTDPMCLSKETGDSDIIALNHNPEKCSIYELKYPDEIIPLLIVEYHYLFKDSEFPYEFDDDDNLLLENDRFRQAKTAIESRHCNIDQWFNLFKIDIRKMNITSFGVNECMPKVGHLDISHNKLNTLYEIFCIFPNLTTLHASFNEINDIFSSIERPNLNYLDLSWNSLTQCIQSLKNLRSACPKLEFLSLKYNKFIDLNDAHHEAFFALKLFKNLTLYNYETKEELGYSNVNQVYNFEKNYEYYHVLHFPMKYFFASDIKLTFSDWKGEHCTGQFKGKHISVNENEETICIFIMDDPIIYQFSCKQKLNKLLSFTITGNRLKTTGFLKNMQLLNELNLSFNLLETIDNSIASLLYLVRLNLCGNYIRSLENLRTATFAKLKFLQISKNLLTSLIGIHEVVSLEELYVSFNNITKLEEFSFTKKFKMLKIIDVRDNRIEDMSVLRRYLIYHVPSLEYINGTTVEDAEVNEAMSTIGGVLDADYLQTLLKSKDMAGMTELNVINSSIKRIGLFGCELESLTSVNLENNFLTTMAELLPLINLKTLCLSNNQITKFGDEKDTMVFSKLEVLYLNMNSISNMETLQFHRMPKLKTLFIQDNVLTSISGISKLICLQHLILDRNKIGTIHSNEIYLLRNLHDLYIESNQIQKLDFLPFIKKLKRLFLSQNRVQNIDALRNLRSVPGVQELTISGNPVCRTNEPYVKILMYLPNLTFIDGYKVESRNIESS